MKTNAAIATALITAGLGIGTGSTVANAASWHNGTPSALRGKWKTKTYHNRFVSGYSRTYITKHSIHTQTHTIGGSSDNMPPIIEHAKYRYLGNHLYTFKGTMYGGNIKTTCLVKWKSHHHIVINPKWGHNPSENYYRY
jgi:hypothetical protein